MKVVINISIVNWYRGSFFYSYQNKHFHLIIFEKANAWTHLVLEPKYA